MMLPLEGMCMKQTKKPVHHKNPSYFSIFNKVEVQVVDNHENCEQKQQTTLTNDCFSLAKRIFSRFLK